MALPLPILGRLELAKALHLGLAPLGLAGPQIELAQVVVDLAVIGSDLGQALEEPSRALDLAIAQVHDGQSIQRVGVLGAGRRVHLEHRAQRRELLGGQRRQREGPHRLGRVRLALHRPPIGVERLRDAHLLEVELAQLQPRPRLVGSQLDGPPARLQRRLGVAPIRLDCAQQVVHRALTLGAG